MSRVHLSRCDAYERAAVEASVDATWTADIARGSRVLVKPNFLRAAGPERCVSPHPEVVRAVCLKLLEAGATVTIADSPAFGSARGVAATCGVLAVADELGIEVRGYSAIPTYVRTGAPTNLTLQLAREVMEADAVINLCKLKSHQQLGMTLAVKNLFGCIVGKRKPAWHMRLGDRDNLFGEMLLEVYRHVAPVLNVCDGVIGMEGNGPGHGDPRPVGVIAASDDGVALDVILATLVGFDPEELRTTRAARALGVGTPDRAGIEIVGDPLEGWSIDDWKRPEGLPIFFNPVRVGVSTAKQVGYLVRRRLS